MIASLRAAQIDQPRIRDNGGNISGGQKQRIALARVMLKKSDVIILDEAFSALDPITAEQILSDIMKSDCMTIIVFHKYDRSLLSHFDEIFAMKRGKIIERGSFETLMQKRGLSAYLITDKEPETSRKFDKKPP